MSAAGSRRRSKSPGLTPSAVLGPGLAAGEDFGSPGSGSGQVRGGARRGISIAVPYEEESGLVGVEVAGAAVEGTMEGRRRPERGGYGGSALVLKPVGDG